MKKVIAVAAGSMLLFLLVWGGLKIGSQEKPNEEGRKAKPLPLVAVEAARSTSISRNLDLTGSATPTRQARLASPGEGPIQNCRVREGDEVRRGQRLLVIGRSGAAAAQVAAAAESVKEQEAELNRIKILVQSGAVPGSQLDTARAKYEGARALLAKAREQAGDYSVDAPWDGVVAKVLVKDGDYVAPRAPLVEMYDPQSLVIKFAVPEADATEVFKGMPVKVQLDAYAGKEFPGKISRVYPELDSRMRTRTVEAMLDYEIKLIPGMFARLQLPLQTVTDAVVVPAEAVLVAGSGERYGFVVQDGKAVRRGVEIGIEAGGRVQVLKGINPGELIVTAGNEKLKDGLEVKVQEGEKK